MSHANKPTIIVIDPKIKLWYNIRELRNIPMKALTPINLTEWTTKVVYF